MGVVLGVVPSIHHSPCNMERLLLCKRGFASEDMLVFPPVLLSKYLCVLNSRKNKSLDFA